MKNGKHVVLLAHPPVANLILRSVQRTVLLVVSVKLLLFAEVMGNVFDWKNVALNYHVLPYPMETIANM